MKIIKQSNNTISQYHSYKDFPKIIQYEGKEYYNEGERGYMTTSTGGIAQSYIHWDDANNAHYISVNEYGEVEDN